MDQNKAKDIMEEEVVTNLEGPVNFLLAYAVGGILLKVFLEKTNLPYVTSIQHYYWTLNTFVGSLISIGVEIFILLALLVVALTVETRAYLGLELRNNGPLILKALLLYLSGGSIYSAYKLYATYASNRSRRDIVDGIWKVYGYLLFTGLNFLIVQGLQ